MPHPALISLRLTVVVSFLTTWFTVSATLGNAVVPETSFDTMDHVQTIIEHRSHATPSVLIATDAISAELTSIKKSAKSDPGVAQIESTVLSMTKAMAAPSCLAKDSSDTSDKKICKAKTTKTDCEGLVDASGNKRCTLADTDGGTKDMDDQLKSAISSINTAVDTMLSGTKTDYGSAKVDLKALDEAIDISKKTISTADLETIRAAATTWCAKKRALETATTDKQTAAQTLTNKLNAPLGITDLKLSEVGPIGEGDCSQTNGNVETLTSCPTYSCSDDNLAQRIKEKIATGRAAYLTASWDKHNKDAAFDTATNENTAKKATFKDKVETTASTYHSMCGSDDTVHATAVNSFNANNANRASTYLSLGIIKCHINHMKSGQAYAFTTADLLKSASSNSATSSTDCIANLKTAANIKAALFPDASSNEDSSKVCPALNVYVQEVHDYGGFGFKTDWNADVAKCSAAASAPPAPAPAAAGADISQPPKATTLITGTHSTTFGRNRFWSKLATSEDGNLVFATEANHDKLGALWKSTDGGTTFSEVTALRDVATAQTPVSTNRAPWSFPGTQTYMKSVAGSKDLKVVVAINMERMFISRDYGVTWTVAPSVIGRQGNHPYSDSFSLSSVAVSADGSVIYANTYTYNLWVSRDGGVSFTSLFLQATTHGASSVTPNGPICTSSDGKFVALIAMLEIWVSEDYGKYGSWVKRDPPAPPRSTPHKQAIDCSADGNRLAVLGNGHLYTSVDKGVSWTDKDMASDGGSARCVKFCGSDMDNLVIGSYADANVGLTTSSNFGVDWTAIPGTLKNIFVDVACSADATKMMVQVVSHYNPNPMLPGSTDHQGFMFKVEY